MAPVMRLRIVITPEMASEIQPRRKRNDNTFEATGREERFRSAPAIVSPKKHRLPGP